MRTIILHDTAAAFCAGLQTEHRALRGWESLEAGTYLVTEAPGEYTPDGWRPGPRLGMVRIDAVRRERLNRIRTDAVRRQGFTDTLPDDFVAMFCRRNACAPNAIVTVMRWTILQRQQTLFPQHEQHTR